jgi:rhodanese-related sulfurtransferase
MREAALMAERYAGDISPQTAWEILTDDPGAVLIDVRTDAEWKYVGTPDLSDLGKRPLKISWKHFPEMRVNERFVEQVQDAGVEKQDTVVLLCRSGQRSAEAAASLTESGFLRCYNVEEGFEGGKDEEGRRGVLEGWKARELPWVQD